MRLEFDKASWRKSTRSHTNGACVELALVSASPARDQPAESRTSA
jgi:hypothetical protein